LTRDDSTQALARSGVQSFAPVIAVASARIVTCSNDLHQAWIGAAVLFGSGFWPRDAAGARGTLPQEMDDAREFWILVLVGTDGWRGRDRLR
jgi:hypothetical protein